MHLQVWLNEYKFLVEVNLRYFRQYTKNSRFLISARIAKKRLHQLFSVIMQIANDGICSPASLTVIKKMHASFFSDKKPGFSFIWLNTLFQGKLLFLIILVS